MIYDFKCKTCGTVSRDVSLSIRHTVDERPKCCGVTMPMYFQQFPQVHWKHYELEGGGFIAHGIKGRPVITSMRQRKEMMERNDLLDANDFGAPPTKEEQVRFHNEVIRPSIDQVMPSGPILQEMKERGLADIVE